MECLDKGADGSVGGDTHEREECILVESEAGR